MSLAQNPSISFALVSTAGALLASEGAIVSSARSGAGVYSVVSSQGYALLQSRFLLSIISGAGNANGQVTTADGLTFAVTTFVAAVATDEQFMLTLEPIRT